MTTDFAGLDTTTLKALLEFKRIRYAEMEHSGSSPEELQQLYRELKQIQFRLTGAEPAELEAERPEVE